MGVAPDGCRACNAACCRTCGHPPFETVEEVNALPAEQAAELTAYYAGAGLEGPTRRAPQRPCIWLDQEANRCLHYDHRPRLCREYVADSETCRGEQDYQRRLGNLGD